MELKKVMLPHIRWATTTAKTEIKDQIQMDLKKTCFSINCGNHCKDFLRIASFVFYRFSKDIKCWHLDSFYYFILFVSQIPSNILHFKYNYVTFWSAVDFVFTDLVQILAEQHYQENKIVLVKERDSVTISCLYQGDMAMHFSWYKHKVSQKPVLISSMYKYDKNIIFYNEFKNDGRFDMFMKEDTIYLNFNNVQLSDSATYYCGTAHSNIVEFAQGTELIIKGNYYVDLCLICIEHFYVKYLFLHPV